MHSRRWPAALWHVRDARAFVVACVDSWDATVIREDLRIVTSELVTNAVVHAGTPFTVAVAWNGDVVLLQVTDESATLPVYAGGSDRRLGGNGRPDSLDRFGGHGGRGLMLVDAMTLDWGSTRAVSGKTVWAVLDAESTAVS